jgi:hypothetical protein
VEKNFALRRNYFIVRDRICGLFQFCQYHPFNRRGVKMRPYKIVLISIAVFIFYSALIGGGFYYLGWKNHRQSIQPSAGFNQSVVTVYTQKDKSNPGSILIDRWIFDKEFGQFYVNSSGGGCELQVSFSRPEQWRPKPTIKHFIGAGVTVRSMPDIVYGGYISYRYAITERWSVRTEFSLAMNQALKYDVGVSAGFEAGIF